MHERLYDAFDGIRADENTRDKTLAVLRARMIQSPRRGLSLRRVVAVAATLILLAATTLSALYFTPAAHIDMDINPSLSLSVNRFGRIIAADAFNPESEVLLSQTNLRNKTYPDGLGALLESAFEQGYMDEDGLLSITLQAEDEERERAILQQLEAAVGQALRRHHNGTQTEIYAVNREQLDTAHQHGVSPAKYAAITALQEVDDTARFEECAHHSISELRQRTNSHADHGEQAGEEQGVDPAANGHAQKDAGHH